MNVYVRESHDWDRAAGGQTVTIGSCHVRVSKHFSPAYHSVLLEISRQKRIEQVLGSTWLADYIWRICMLLLNCRSSSNLLDRRMRFDHMKQACEAEITELMVRGHEWRGQSRRLEKGCALPSGALRIRWLLRIYRIFRGWLGKWEAHGTKKLEGKNKYFHMLQESYMADYDNSNL